MRSQVKWIVRAYGGGTLQMLVAEAQWIHNQAVTDQLPLMVWAKRFLSDHFYLAPGRMHAWLSQRLEQMPRGTRLALLAPRDSAKSTWLSLAYPLYCVLSGRERYILLTAETAEQARRYLQTIRRELETNTTLQSTYPDAGRGTVWRANRITLPSGAEIEAISTGQNLRGRRSASARPTLVVVDDPQGRRNVASSRQRAGDWSWLTQDLLNVGSPRTSYIVAGTSLHREALVDRLARQPGWEARRFAAIERFPEDAARWKQWETIYTDRENAHRGAAANEYYQRHREAMDRGARVAWPRREGIADLMRRRVDIGRAAFEAEKQGNPLDPELCEWPQEYFGDSLWFDEWPERWLVKTMALDPSKGADARVGDYSAFVMLGVDARGYVYIEADLRRRPAEEIIAEGVEWYRRFQPDAFGCESNAWQDLLGAEFEAAFARQGMLAVRPWALDNHEPKVVRIRRLGPWLSQRRLRFKTNSPGTALLVEQLQDFPIGEHDDGPDALEMAIRLAERMSAGHEDGLGDRLAIDVG